MIKFILFLAVRFLWIRNLLQSFVNQFENQFPKQVDEKKKTEEVCKKNLQLINEYQKLGPSSKLPAPKIYKQPRGV